MAQVDVTATNHPHFIFPVRELVMIKEEFQVHEVQIHGTRLIFNRLKFMIYETMTEINP